MKVQYFNKYIIESCNDNHLKYLLSFKTSEGKTRFKDGTLEFFNTGNPEDYLNTVLYHQTDFVKENIMFVEIAIPNRNQYGRLDPGYIKDTVFLCATP